MDWREKLEKEIAARGLDMKAVSLGADLGATYVRDALKRGRGGKVAELRKIAVYLGHPPNWLIEDGEPSAGIYRPPPTFMNERDTMPVFASAEGGEGAIIVSTSEIDRVPRPYTLEGINDAYAILITGESMVPAYEPGDFAWVNPRLPPQRDTDCILYELDGKTGEGRASIKRLVSWTAKTWNLKQWNPKREFSLDRASWSQHHRVVGNFRRR